MSWAGALAAGEIAVGVALLNGGRWGLVGFLAVVAFHLALLCFGCGTWLWSVPVLAVVLPVTVGYGHRLRPAA